MINKQTESKKHLQKMKARYSFDIKYGEGATDRLLELAHKFDRIDDIGRTFNITGARVAQILEVLLGMPYSQYLAKHNVERQGVKRSG